MPKKPTAGQRKKSHKNVKRQAGSLTVWLNEKTNAYHQNVLIHNGRITRKYIGPEAIDNETAHEMLNEDLKRGV